MDSYLENNRIKDDIEHQEQEKGKLTIQHLAPYLPYGLKIQNGWGDIKKMNYSYLDDENNGFISNVKPILRPLSDLTKEIEIDGEKFVPIDKLSYHFEIEIIDNMLYKNVLLLLEWHFDIFRLIKNNLAIDINELNVEL